MRVILISKVGQQRPGGLELVFKVMGLLVADSHDKP